MQSLIDALKASLSEPRNDGVLHFSQHLQHDRHTVLYMAHGYPSVVPSWGRLFPLVQGTGVHETLHDHMRKICKTYLAEYPISVTNSIPNQRYVWGGTVDAFAEIEDQHWILDYKTISGPGMLFLEDAPKPDHVLQVSAYNAFKPDGIVDHWRAAVMYFPSSSDYKNNWHEPRFVEFEPISKQDIIKRMVEVEDAIDQYKANSLLPDAPEGTYTWKKKPRTKKVTYELLYRPHYTTLFCPWASLVDDPCGCSEDKSKVIATFCDDELNFDDEYGIIVEKIGVPSED